MYSSPYSLNLKHAAGMMLVILVVLLMLPLASADMSAHENVQLTSSLNNNHPSWSPDGKKIVFASDRAIWVINSDGSGKKRLYDNLAWDGDPVFNQDGSKIYFATESKSAYSGRYISIHAMDADGSNVVKLTETADARYPSISPDGTRVAYVSRLAGNYDVWIMDIDGSNNVQLTDSPGDESSPSWSPDGRSIVYSLDSSILVQETDSVIPVVLLDNSYDNIEPSYSPDGEMIVFSSDQGGDYDLWVMGASGKGFTMLTSGSSNERSPVWSPDGSKIVYISNEDGEYNIWLMELESESMGLAEFEEDEEVEEDQKQLNPYLNKIRIFAAEDPRTFILSVLLFSFFLVSIIVYSFLRKIR